MAYNYKSLNPEKALIWRILHRDNIPWVLENGLHCRNSPIQDPNYVNIGNADLISKRATHSVPIDPKGTLNDYVPFYFTPFSVMMKNIHSGWGEIEQRQNEEIVILVSSMHYIHQQELRYLFTNSHAYYKWTDYYDDLSHLNVIDWSLLQQRDFKRDPDDPAKFERYQAEALIYQYCPISALLGIVCYTDELKLQLEQQIAERELELVVHTRKDWYF